MIFECRLDPPPDPPPEPGAAAIPSRRTRTSRPTSPEPFEGPGTGSSASARSTTTSSSRASTTSRCGRSTRTPTNVDLTPATYDWDDRPHWPRTRHRPGRDRPGHPDRRRARRRTSTTGTATFRFAGSDNATPGRNLTFECRLDGAGVAQTCTNPQQPTAETWRIGPHTFEVRAIDRDGQRRPDARRPTPGRSSRRRPTRRRRTTTLGPDRPGPDHRPQRRDVHVLERATRPRPSSARSTGAGTATFAAVHVAEAPVHRTSAVGAHAFRVRAVDPAGNADPTPATYTWTGRRRARAERRSSAAR